MLLVRMLGRMRCRMRLAHRRIHLLTFSLSLSRSLSRTQQILVTVVIGTFVLLLLQRGCNKAATETVHKYKSLAATREGEQCSPSRARTLLQRLLHSFCCTLSTLCQVHPSAL
jgi:hypothetical protein